jgi:hypothetical protein
MDPWDIDPRAEELLERCDCSPINRAFLPREPAPPPRSK